MTRIDGSTDHEGIWRSTSSTRSQRTINSHILARASVRTFNRRPAPSGTFYYNLTHQRASKVLPVRKAIFKAWKTGFFSHSGHKIAAEIGNTGKPKNGVFLPFFLSRLTCGACWLSGGGMRIALAPCLSGGVCGYTWDRSWQSGAEYLSRLCWRALDGRQTWEIE